MPCMKKLSALAVSLVLACCEVHASPKLSVNPRMNAALRTAYERMNPHTDLCQYVRRRAEHICRFENRELFQELIWPAMDPSLQDLMNSAFPENAVFGFFAFHAAYDEKNPDVPGAIIRFAVEVSLPRDPEESRFHAWVMRSDATVLWYLGGAPEGEKGAIHIIRAGSEVEEFVKEFESSLRWTVTRNTE